jgi:hypothetical protein
MFLENLEKLIAVKNVPDFLRKYKKVYRDPVVDPRENWKEWTKRQIEFKDPPPVERETNFLPNYSPKSTIWQSFHLFERIRNESSHSKA